MNTTSEKSKARILTGKVVSIKMKDTIVVEVNRFVAHPKYRKYVNHASRFKAHDVGNIKKEGEKVRIVECAPISKDKHFRVLTERSEV